MQSSINQCYFNVVFAQWNEQIQRAALISIKLISAALVEYLMTILNTVLLVLFVIVAILLILLVLVQNEEGDSLGGVFAGGGGSAFGSRSGNVLTRASTVLGGIFLVLAFTMALLTRAPRGSGVEAAGRALTPDSAATEWWSEDAEAGTDVETDTGADTETAAGADAGAGAGADAETGTDTETGADTEAGNTGGDS
jgi:preprotein translocase subunit SecG